MEKTSFTRCEVLERASMVEIELRQKIAGLRSAFRPTNQREEQAGKLVTADTAHDTRHKENTVYAEAVPHWQGQDASRPRFAPLTDGPLH